MPSKLPDGSFIIAAGEIAEFTVCPRAWQLRQLATGNDSLDLQSIAGKESHSVWTAKADQLFVAASHAKFVIGLTLAVLFVWECTRRLSTVGILAPDLSFEIGLVSSLLISLLAVLFFLNRNLSAERRSVGIANESSVVALDGSDVKQTKEYVSERLKLAGRPDALVIESGVPIPVEYKPNARRIRDRYIAQLLVYLRLIEESDGVRPGYGYIVIGARSKRVKIENSPSRQKWLQGELDIMRAVLAESMPAPTRPLAQKCSKCSVRAQCPDAADGTNR